MGCLRNFSDRIRTIVLGVSLLTGAQLYGQSINPASNGLPAGDGREVVATACTQCHTVTPILMLRDGPQGWNRTVNEMIMRGAQLVPKDAEAAVKYLSTNFGPGINPMRSGPSEPKPLADGDGEGLVESHCLLCHDTGRIIGTRRSKEEWTETVQNMMSRMSGFANPEQIQKMSTYLSAQYGIKDTSTSLARRTTPTR